MKYTNDIVFHPNHAGVDGELTNRWENFQECCADEDWGWSSKKTSVVGDLYFFWFGEPLSFIGGIGVHTGELEDDDTWNAMGCFNPMIELANPIPKSTIKNDPVLGRWWGGQPFMGGPKTMLKNEKAALRMLSLVVEQNPDQEEILAPYVRMLGGNTRPSPNKKKVKDRKQKLSGVDSKEQERIKREVLRIERDRLLRPAVLAVWGTLCAACGISLQGRETSSVGCEVAHIQEVKAAGTDELSNALPLCRNCHWAFDQRLFVIDPPALTIFVSLDYRWGSFLAPLHGKPLHAKNNKGPQGLDQNALQSRLDELQQKTPRVICHPSGVKYTTEVLPFKPDQKKVLGKTDFSKALVHGLWAELLKGQDNSLGAFADRIIGPLWNTAEGGKYTTAKGTKAIKKMLDELQKLGVIDEY